MQNLLVMSLSCLLYLAAVCKATLCRCATHYIKHQRHPIMPTVLITIFPLPDNACTVPVLYIPVKTNIVNPGSWACHLALPICGVRDEFHVCVVYCVADTC